MTDYLNNSNKTTLLFKKFQNKSQAAIDVTTNGSGGTSFFNEQKKSLNNIYNTDIFIENIERNLSDEYKLSSLDACGNIPGSVWNTSISDQDYSNSSFSIPNTNLIFYKEIYLNPVSATNNAWWLIPSEFSDQITDNNLLKDMIPFNFNSISLSSFSPIVKYWNGTQWRTQSQNNTSGLNWLIDYASGILQFYQNDSILNSLNIDCNSSDEKKRPRISFIKYVGEKGLENFSGGGGDITGDLNDTSIILSILQQYFPISLDINGNTLIQQIDNFNITGNLSVTDDANIDGNLVVDGFFGGNYYGPMGSIRTITFSSIPGNNSDYYYLGEFTSHLPSHIYILGSGNSSGSGSIFTIARHYGATPHISGILGERYYIYRFFYQSVTNNNSYYLWFRPYVGSAGITINVTVKIQSYSYNFLSEPANPSYTECIYGLIQQNETNVTYLGVGTYNPTSTTSSAVSDDRLKFNETTITNGLSVINKLNPVIYDMSPEFNNEVRTRKRSGFVAQEVYEIDDLKHSINVGNDSNPWSIHYNDIFTYSIAGLKELNIIVQNQDKEITSLKQKNLELENKLNEILIELGKKTV